MNVDFINDEYTEHLPIWQTIRDCVAGEKAIKDRDRSYSATLKSNNLTNDNFFYSSPVYLPMPNPTDNSPENMARYAQYLQRASFVGYTGRTLNGMMGMVFRTEPKIELPPEMEYLETDADGTEVGLAQQAEEVARDVGSVGRAGLYTDYPKTNGQVTRADVENAGMRATINFYSAECILDWDCKRFGASTKLTYVKLKEEVCERNSDYVLEKKYRYRCLMLSDDQVYSVTVYNDSGDKIESFEPKTGADKPFDHIPFQFIGAANNRPSIDDAPLQEIADVNIKHYRNSADYEESSFIVGQPTLFMAGMSEGWMKEFYKDGIPFGSRAGLAGPQGSSADLLQAQANSMPMEGMKHKEDQMVALGARVVTNGGQAETAEAARIKHEADTSSLSVGVRNINTGYSKALQDVALFTYPGNVPEEIVFELNTQLIDMTLTPEQAEAIVRVWQSGAIDKDVLDSKLKKGGIIYDAKDLEEMNGNIDNEDQGLNLNASDSDQQ